MCAERYVVDFIPTPLTCVQTPDSGKRNKHETRRRREQRRTPGRRHGVGRKGRPGPSAAVYHPTEQHLLFEAVLWQPKSGSSVADPSDTPYARPDLPVRTYRTFFKQQFLHVRSIAYVQTTGRPVWQNNMTGEVTFARPTGFKARKKELEELAEQKELLVSKRARRKR